MSPDKMLKWMLAGLVFVFLAIGFAKVAKAEECNNVASHVEEFDKTFRDKEYGLRMYLRQSEDKTWVIYVVRSDVQDRLMLIFFKEDQCPHPVHPNGRNWIFAPQSDHFVERIRDSEHLYSNPAAKGEPNPASVEKI